MKLLGMTCARPKHSFSRLAIQTQAEAQEPIQTLRRTDANNNNKKNALFFLSVNVFSTKVLIGDTIFTSPTGDGTAIST